MHLKKIAFGFLATFALAQEGPLLPQEEIGEGQESELPAALKEEPLVEEPLGFKPVNFLELKGYFRFRTLYLNSCDLGTVVPNLPNTRTSRCPVPISYFAQEEAAGTAPLDVILIKNRDRNHSLWNLDMRLRLEPVLHVMENVRLHSRLDLFDNWVLGAGGGSLREPIHAFMPSGGPVSASQALWFKQLYAEAEFPFGAFLVGRVPMHFGLGLLYHAGNDFALDEGDQLDGLFFLTQVLDHEVKLGYVVPYSGAFGRWDKSLNGPFDLDTSDNVHGFYLHIQKQQDYLSYGVMGKYQYQVNDSTIEGVLNDIQTARRNWFKRNAQVGAISLFGDWSVGHLQIQSEVAGQLGHVANTAGLSADLQENTLNAGQMGFILRSQYGFLQDRLWVGLDGGYASGSSKEAKNRHNAFSFHPNMQVDQILFKQVLGSVTNAYYIKPHVEYRLTPHMGLRLDTLAAFAAVPNATPGEQGPLGFEIDATAYYRHDEWYASFQAGYLFPFAGLSHPLSMKTAYPALYDEFGTAQNALSLQLMVGILF